MCCSSSTFLSFYMIFVDPARPLRLNTSYALARSVCLSFYTLSARLDRECVRDVFG